MTSSRITRHFTRPLSGLIPELLPGRCSKRSLSLLTRIPSLILAGLLLSVQPAAAQTSGGFSGSATSPSGLDDGGGLRRPLPLERAFPWFVSILGEDSLAVTWSVAEGHYLYRHQFEFALQTPGSDEPLPLRARIPTGKQSHDQFFGDIEIYEAETTVYLQLPRRLGELPSGTALLLNFQGCASWGYCYPPQEVSYPIVP